MTSQRIDLWGQGWQTLEGHPSPTIYGDITRDFDRDCVGVHVGVTALQTNRHANAHAVADHANGRDAVFVERLPGEQFYSGLAPSLVQRVASLHGTGLPWRLEYRA